MTNGFERAPMVSIVLPAYKGEFFRAAVRGILAQTYEDFELIVVDDASPFDFPRVLKSFNDKRIVYHRNETNIGRKDLAKAYNHACSFAKGRYLVLASDDDVYMPTYLERMVNIAESHPKTSLFSCMVGHIDECGKLKDPGVPVLPKETALYFMFMHEARRRHLTLFEWFMRRSSLDAIGGIAHFPLGWFSDTKTMYMLASHNTGGVRFVPEMLCMYRDSSIQLSNPSTGLFQKCEATLKFYEWFGQYIDAYGESLIASTVDSVVLCRLKEAYPLYAKALLLQLFGYADNLHNKLKIGRIICCSGYVKKKNVVFVFLCKIIGQAVRFFTNHGK